MTQLLIGTYHNLLHWNGSKIRTVRKGRHYGITWDHAYTYASHNPLYKNISVIETYNKLLMYCGALSMPRQLCDVHQLYWYDKMLYITNTRYDRLEVWSGRHVRTIDWTGRPYTEERLHINSLWCNGKRWYVCEHGYKCPPVRIRVFDMQWNQLQLFELDYEVNNDLNGHNVYVDDKYMYVCRHQHIDVRDSLTGHLIEKVFPHGDDASSFLLRGMARTSEYFYIGESTLASRHLRGDGDSDILILDDQLQLVDNIFLPSAGQVYDIRVIDVMDYAHNNILCPARRV